MTITKVSEKLLRGAHPGNSDLQALKGLGVTRILNLQTGVNDLVDGELYSEDDRAQELGMQVFHIRFSDFLPPSAEQVDQALAKIKDGQSWYVHCLHGVDRTGYLCAAYRVLVMGWPMNEAISEMKDRGFHLFPYFFWIPSLKRYCATTLAART